MRFKRFGIVILAWLMCIGCEFWDVRLMKPVGLGLLGWCMGFGEEV